jgi:hypothetical protein
LTCLYNQKTISPYDCENTLLPDISIAGPKMAALAPVLFPEMSRRGSDPGDLTGWLAATGAQTQTAPLQVHCANQT